MMVFISMTMSVSMTIPMFFIPMFFMSMSVSVSMFFFSVSVSIPVSMAMSFFFFSMSVSMPMSVPMSVSMSMAMPMTVTVTTFGLMDIIKDQSILSDNWIKKCLKFIFSLLEIIFLQIVLLIFHNPINPFFTFWVEHFSISLKSRFPFQFIFLVLESFFDIVTELLETVFSFNTFFTYFIIFFEVFGIFNHLGNFISRQSGFFIGDFDFFFLSR